MANPSKYTQGYDFSGFQDGNPSTPLPADRLDTELANISTSTEELRDAIMDVRRADGGLKNRIVTRDSLSSNLLALTGADTGAWVTATAYVVGDLVTSSSRQYQCLVAHTSGTFATDLAAGKWVLTAAESSEDAAASATAAAASAAIAVHTIDEGPSIDVDATDPNNPLVSLVNDTANPGDNRVYGTDDVGARGWQNLDARYLRITSDPVKDLLRIGCAPEDAGKADANAALIDTAINDIPSTGGVLLIPARRFYVGDIAAVSNKGITIQGAGKQLSALIATQTGPGSVFLDLQQDDFTDSVRLAGFSLECETASLVRALRVQFGETDATNNRLQARATIADLSIRGSDVGAHGFLSGIDLVNVHRPRVVNVDIAGRQNGAGPSAFQHMEHGIQLSTSGAAAPTDFMFRDVNVAAAAVAYEGTGAIEGVLFDRCLAIAVGKGFEFILASEKPWINISRSHVAAFTHCIDLQKFWQFWITDNLLYKREDANADTIGANLVDCDNGKISRNTFINVAGLPATFGNFDGIIASGCDKIIITENEFGGCQKGVDLQGTSSSNLYETSAGQWHDAKGTGALTEYQVSGTGAGNVRRGQVLSASNRNSGGAVVVTGGAGVAVCSTSTDTLEVGDDIEVNFSMRCDKDANAGMVRALALKVAGTATVTFDNTNTQMDAAVYCAASQTAYLRGSAKGTVTVRGSFQIELQGFAPANAFTVPVDGGQIHILRR